jgi:ribonuclease Z
MIEVTVLGTSGSSPAVGRQMPAVALRHEGEVFLFDCGEGTQMQMLKYGINSYRLKAIFISHSHGDHIIGIAGLVRTLALSNRKDDLSIFVPRGQERIIRTLVLFDKALIGYKINIIGVGSGVIYKGKDFTVSAFRLNHTIPTCGYVFKENDRRKFLKEKCRRLGIEGEMFGVLTKKGRIKIGNKTISLNSVTELKVGRKIVYAVDTRPTSATIAAAKNADLLIHESSYTDEFRKLAIMRKHSTALEVATVAKKAHVRRLCLVHISTRFKTGKPLIDEARKVFRNTIAAEDGEKIDV